MSVQSPQTRNFSAFRPARKSAIAPGRSRAPKVSFSTSRMWGQAGMSASATAATAGASLWPSVPRMQWGTGRSPPSRLVR